MSGMAEGRDVPDASFPCRTWPNSCALVSPDLKSSCNDSSPLALSSPKRWHRTAEVFAMDGLAGFKPASNEGLPWMSAVAASRASPWLAYFYLMLITRPGIERTPRGEGGMDDGGPPPRPPSSRWCSIRP